jgi:hypothetical protein
VGFDFPCVETAFCAVFANDNPSASGLCVAHGISRFGEPCAGDTDCVDSGTSCGRGGRCFGCDDAHPCPDQTDCLSTCGVDECVADVDAGDICEGRCFNNLLSIRNCRDGLTCTAVCGSNVCCE